MDAYAAGGGGLCVQVLQRLVANWGVTAGMGVSSAGRSCALCGAGTGI